MEIGQTVKYKSHENEGTRMYRRRELGASGVAVPLIDIDKVTGTVTAVNGAKWVNVS